MSIKFTNSMTNIALQLRVGNVNGTIIHNTLLAGESITTSKANATNDVYFLFTAYNGYYLPAEITRRATRDTGGLVTGLFEPIPENTISWGDTMTALGARSLVEVLGDAVVGEPTPVTIIDVGILVKPLEYDVFVNDVPLNHNGVTYDSISVETNFTVTIKAVTGKELTLPITDSNYTYTGTVNQVQCTYTIPLEPTHVSINPTVNTTDYVPPPIVYTVKHKPIIQEGLNQYIEVYVNDVLQTISGDGLSYPDIVTETDFKITYKSNPPYQFTLPLIDSYYDTNTSEYINYTYVGDGNELSFTYPVPIPDWIDNTIDPSIVLELRPQPPVTHLPFNKLYRIDEVGLRLLNNFRFTQLTDNTVDYGSYITSMLRVPFTVSSELPDTNILIGDVLTNIPATPIETSIYSMSLGSIYIPNLTYGSVGYSNVFVELFVPYFKKVALDTDEVLGQTIDITLELDLITGMGTVNVLNRLTNSIIYSDSTQLANQIPYIIGEYHNDLTHNVLHNETDNAYVEVKMLVPSNTSFIETADKTNMGGVAYIKVDNPIVESFATYQEKTMMVDLIRKGVYVNA